MWFIVVFKSVAVIENTNPWLEYCVDVCVKVHRRTDHEGSEGE
jgi:hypothetical protein